MPGRTPEVHRSSAVGRSRSARISPSSTDAKYSATISLVTSGVRVGRLVDHPVRAGDPDGAATRLDLDSGGLRHGASKPDASDGPRHVGWTTVSEAAPDRPDVRHLPSRRRSPSGCDGLVRGAARGFHQGRTSEELRRHFREHLDADDVVLRGVWQDAPGARLGRDPGRDVLELRQDHQHRPRAAARADGQRRHGQPDPPAPRAAAGADDRGPRRTRSSQGVPLAVLTAPRRGRSTGGSASGRPSSSTPSTVDTGPRFALRGPPTTARSSCSNPPRRGRRWPRSSRGSTSAPAARSSGRSSTRRS